MSVVPRGDACLPSVLAVEQVHDVFGQCDGCSRRCVELVDVVCLLHFHVVLWKLVHDFSQILVDGGKDGHANREVGRPEQRLLSVLCQGFHVVLVVGHPSRRSAHHLHVVLKGPQVVAVGRCGVGKLYGHIGRCEGRAVKVVLVVHIDFADNFMAAGDGDLLNHVSHLSVADQCNLHVRFSFEWFDCCKSTYFIRKLLFF